MLYKFRLKLVLYVLIPLLVKTLSGSVGECAAREYRCQYTDIPPKIDGIINETCWQRTEKIHFYHLGRGSKGLQTHPPAFSPTTARLCWDEDYLYIAMEATDKDLWATLTEHDAVLCREDCLEIFLKPKKDVKSYYEFEFSPKNVTWDLFYPSRGVSAWDSFWSSYESGLKSATQIEGTLNEWHNQDKGWTLEVGIPFPAFIEVVKPPPGDEDRWYFALCRYDYSVYLEDVELSSSARLKEVNFHRYEDYDILIFQK